MLYIIPNDLLSLIKDYLENKDILSLYLTGKNLLKSENLFTSIKITNENWFDSIKNYIKHKKSIKNVYIINMQEAEVFFPFYNECIYKIHRYKSIYCK